MLAEDKEFCCRKYT